MLNSKIKSGEPQLVKFYNTWLSRGFLFISNTSGLQEYSSLCPWVAYVQSTCLSLILSRFRVTTDGGLNW
jgi:hypothetical protein